MTATKKILLAAAVSAAFAASTPTWATTSFTFDPTGTAGAAGDIAGVSTIDEKPGSALAVGGVTAIINFLSNNGGSTNFDLLYQANLNTLDDVDGNTLFTNGQGNNFFTVVAGFGETVLTAGGIPGSATFGFNPSGSTNFFYIYATSAQGNNLTGDGFTSTKPILEGVISSVKSSGFNLQNPDPVLLDQNGADDWNGQKTVTGSGSTDLTIKITGFDGNYFPDFKNTDIIFSFLNTSQVDPFQQTNPSQYLISSDGKTSAATAAVGTLGATNGINGPNFLFQADANQSIAVPEPASLALMGLGLVGLGFAGRRRV